MCESVFDSFSYLFQKCPDIIQPGTDRRAAHFRQAHSLGVTEGQRIGLLALKLRCLNHTIDENRRMERNRQAPDAIERVTVKKHTGLARLIDTQRRNQIG